MNDIIRQCYKGIAYCHFHPTDMKKKEILDKLLLKAWDLGYSKVSFDKPNKEITIGDMTIWEIGYMFKGLIDSKDLS